ncbi:MAG: ATP-binding protein [Faecousia sp.]
MKILQMTATFGKLEHETLRLEPGLTVIQAPNEWGKSTWCAFLCAMLYGLDTRAKSTKGALADKERYAPWSGSPMEGRLEVEWQGRPITIERRTRGRVPLGEFRAYETDSGIPVPELTAANCGEMLTGAEQSVFRRAGFLRLADLPVTQDEALRRRLNALVTTGDESEETALLEQKLRDLKNKCRYNRSGLLPQAEEQRRELERKKQELEALAREQEELLGRLQELELTREALENHRAALVLAEARRVEALRREAQRELELVSARRETLEALNPNGEEARQKLDALQAIREEWRVLRLEREKMPRKGDVPPAFLRHGAERNLEADAARYGRLKPLAVLCALGALAALMAGAALAVWGWPVPAGICLGAGVLGLAGALWCAVGVRVLRREYGSGNPEQWRRDLEQYGRACRLEERSAAVRKRAEELWGDIPPEEAEREWRKDLELQRDLDSARFEERRCRDRLAALGPAREAAEPAREDSLTLSQEDTEAALAETARERGRLQNLLGQCQGGMEALGTARRLDDLLTGANRRIRELEDTYSALSLALDTLSRARQELQRRFAPRITRRAGELLAALTDGRYERLSWGEDFSLASGAKGEDTLRNALWRSDGTADQLYLALRLAVAEELTPEAPLILDDALVRFDDKRLAAALRLLQEEAEHRQVILFTCQSREKELLARMQRG